MTSLSPFLDKSKSINILKMEHIERGIELVNLLLDKSKSVGLKSGIEPCKLLLSNSPPERSRLKSKYRSRYGSRIEVIQTQIQILQMLQVKQRRTDIPIKTEIRLKTFEVEGNNMAGMIVTDDTLPLATVEVLPRAQSARGILKATFKIEKVTTFIISASINR
ncbi:hypothetical protein SUGI_0874170 [Cryptomeria japonica]|nr:hypothetical protein SUGI_0874170 [Cryptomeria japonica]